MKTEDGEDAVMPPCSQADEPAAKKEEVDPDSQGGRDAAPQAATALTVDNFRNEAMKVFATVLEEHAGPRQYLVHHLGDLGSEACVAFGAELDAQYPAQPGLHYETTTAFQTWPRDATFNMRIADLGFHEQCSTKPPTLKVTCLQLLDEFLLSGFETGGWPRRR